MCFVIIVLSGGPDKTCYSSPENFTSSSSGSQRWIGCFFRSSISFTRFLSLSSGREKFLDRFCSQWLVVIVCKNLRLKLSNQFIRNAIGLQLGPKLCQRHKCVCGKNVTEDGCQGLSCLKSAGRFSRRI